jgi:hypothetical protein
MRYQHRTPKDNEAAQHPNWARKSQHFCGTYAFCGTIRIIEEQAPQLTVNKQQTKGKLGIYCMVLSSYVMRTGTHVTVECISCAATETYLYQWYQSQNFHLLVLHQMNLPKEHPE